MGTLCNNFEMCHHLSKDQMHLIFIDRTTILLLWAKSANQLVELGLILLSIQIGRAHV